MSTYGPHNKALQLTARQHASQVALFLQLECDARAAAEGHRYIAILSDEMNVM